jgi:hypothetical protein
MTAGNPDQEDPILWPSENASATNGESAVDQADIGSVTVETSATEPSVVTADQLADNDVLAAVASVTPEAMINLEHTFDQLISATNLFDVPLIDFDGASDS